MHDLCIFQMTDFFLFQDEERKGSTCRFPLGTKTDALKYINQFTEIFTEEGRKSVEITHKVSLIDLEAINILDKIDFGIFLSENPVICFFWFHKMVLVG